MEIEQKDRRRTNLRVLLDLDAHRTRQIEVEQRVSSRLDDLVPVRGWELERVDERRDFSQDRELEIEIDEVVAVEEEVA